MRSAYSNLYIHLIWSTWKRLELIDHQLEPILYKIITAKCQEIRCSVIAIGGTKNHIHTLVKIRPSICVSELAQHIKGSSAFIINNKMGTNSFYKWQCGYGSITVFPKDIEHIIGYIRNQKAHHSNSTHIPDWENLSKYKKTV